MWKSTVKPPKLHNIFFFYGGGPLKAKSIENAGKCLMQSANMYSTQMDTQSDETTLGYVQ